MAGKKPAKPMAGQAKQQILDPSIYGTQVKYLGDKSSATVCPTCGRSTIRGMVRMKGAEFYCSVRCISATIVKAQDNEAI